MQPHGIRDVRMHAGPDHVSTTLATPYGTAEDVLTRARTSDWKAVMRRSWWMYSIGLAVAWAITLVLVRAVRGKPDAEQTLLVCGGYFLGWVSATIARYIYPPPKKWTSGQGDTPTPRGITPTG